MIVILAAMKQEFDEIVNYLQNPMEKQTVFGDLVEGTIHDTKVVCAQCGIGKAAAAATTTFLIERYTVSTILNIGSAGGLSNDLMIGDVVVVDKVTYHDLDLSAFDYPTGWDNKKYVFTTDQKLNEIALKANKAIDVTIHHGSLVSGDQFIYDKAQFLKIMDTFNNVLAVDMEAAAIAHIASLYTIPFAILRSISDVVIDDNNPEDFSTYIKKAAANSAAIVNHLITQLAGQ